MRVNEGRRVTHMRLAPSTVTGHYLQYSSVYDSFPFRVQASLQKKRVGIFYWEGDWD